MPNDWCLEIGVSLVPSVRFGWYSWQSRKDCFPQLISVSVILEVVLYSEVKGPQLFASEMRSAAVANFLSCCLSSLTLSLFLCVPVDVLKSGIDILVGTPGRIKDHVQNSKLELASVKHVVLDEVDHMLDMGFAEQVEEILGSSYKKGELWHQGRNRGQWRKHSYAALETSGAPPTWIICVMLENGKVELEKVQREVTQGGRAGVAYLEGVEQEKTGRKAANPVPYP